MSDGGTFQARLGMAVVAAASLLTTACGAGGGGGGSDPTARDLASVQGSPVGAARDSDPGAFAADFLRSTHFRSVVVEVDHPAGRPPSPEALALLARRIEDHCDKPGGVLVVLDDAIPLEGFPLVSGHDELRALEDAHRDAFASEKAAEAVVYVICVPGANENDTKKERVVGLSFGASSLALYLDNADRGADPLATTEEMEGTVLVHEMAHLLGLVNNGTPMTSAHEDPDEPHHCSHPDCACGHHLSVARNGPDIDEEGFAAYCAECTADLASFRNP
jgi:hypothetical protein